jgi:dihydrofolate reductase
MIRHIVALDQKHGMAKDGAMPPWHLRQDEAYFTEQTLRDGANVLMGKKTYIEALKYHPLKDRIDYIVTRDPTPIPGAEVINDLATFMADWPKDKVLWVIGGSEIFAQTLDIANELYITEIEGDFGCDRFYPDYLGQFTLVSRSTPVTEHDIRYTFCIYYRTAV